MKRICTLTMLLLVTGLANAQQQITNAGFESWDTLGDYTQPSSWFSLNALVAFGYDATATLTNDAHSGNFAVKLESLSGPFSDLSGVLCTGPILDDQFEADLTRMKVAFSGSPQKFEFYYKADPESGDTGVVSMCLTRWNAALDRTDTVATASKLFYDSVGVYTFASVTFDYILPLPADSMFIIIASSADPFNPVVGSVLVLDDLSLIYPPAGIEKKNAETIAVNVFPNPSATFLNIQSKANIQELWITDYAGKVVYNTNRETKQIDVTNLANGVYFITVLDTNNNRSTQKVSVQH